MCQLTHSLDSDESDVHVFAFDHSEAVRQAANATVIILLHEGFMSKMQANSWRHRIPLLLQEDLPYSASDWLTQIFSC